MTTGRFDSWESYFYPETIGANGAGTLRNKYGERDGFVLREREYAATTYRAAMLDLGHASVSQTYDEEHIRALHRHLFQDVYEWAGDLRTVDIAKGPRQFFADVEGGSPRLRQALAATAEVTRSVDWPGADRAAFIQGTAATFAWFNHAHPFREGNGRTAKAFLHDVAAQSPRFALDFSRVSPGAWNHFSDLSRPEPNTGRPHPENMAHVFAVLTIDRPDRGGAPDHEVGRSRSSVVGMSFPGSAAEAVRSKPERSSPSKFRQLFQRGKGWEDRGR